jgi:hypothetical protein
VIATTPSSCEGSEHTFGSGQKWCDIVGDAFPRGAVPTALFLSAESLLGPAGINRDADGDGCEEAEGNDGDGSRGDPPSHLVLTSKLTYKSSSAARHPLDETATCHRRTTAILIAGPRGSQAPGWPC